MYMFDKLNLLQDHYKYQFLMSQQQIIKKMSQVQRTRPIQKSTPARSSIPLSEIGGRNFIVTSSGTKYKINRRALHVNIKRGSMVFELESTDGRIFIGKLIRLSKQIQAITQIYYLDQLKGKHICNLVDIVKNKFGIWIILQKGHTSLYDYMDKLQQIQVQVILKNIAISYLPFHQKKIAHRDLKGGNIIIQEDLSVKIIDLELCEKVDQLYGTELYIPQHLKQIRWDSSDSHAYGLIARQMVCKTGLVNERIHELIQNCINPNVAQKWGWREIYEFWNIIPKTQSQSQAQSQSQ